MILTHRSIMFVAHAVHIAPTLKVAHLKRGEYAIASIANFGLYVWLAPISDATADHLVQAGRMLIAGSPKGVSGLHVVRGGTELPAASVRKAFSEFLRDHGKLVGDIAVVLEGGGFWASAVRGMLTGLRIASGNSIGFRVDAKLDDALMWLPDSHLDRTGVALSRDDIRGAMTDLLDRTQA